MDENGQPSAQLATVMADLARFAEVSGALSGVWDAAAYRAAIGPINHPSPADTLVQDISIAGVSCKRIVAPGASSSDVVLYLHGGGMVAGNYASHRTVAAWLSYHAGYEVLFPEYRLAPEHPFPAALEDATKVLRCLLDHRRERVVLAGDSAGGGLALSLLVAERDAGRPLPVAAVLICPMLDWDADRAPALKDSAFRRGMAQAYVGANDPRHPHLSPLLAPLHDLPPVFVQAGSNDAFLADAMELGARSGVIVERWEGMPHVWHRHAPFLPEASAALARIGAWLYETLGTPSLEKSGL